MTKKSVNKKSVSRQVIGKLTSKKETKADKLLSLIPEGHSPKVYLDLVKSQVLGNTKEGEERPDEDLMFFLYTAKRTGLDPLVNQIYAVYRWDSRMGKEKMTIQTGIDGMRLVAQRSGDYAGQDDATFTPEDESTQYPVKASVTVYKIVKGARVPFTATARWAEYVQFTKQGQPMGLWSKMPYLMLSKCAEALALRKAFPNELSGIYSDVEMQQASNPIADLPTPDKFGPKEIKVDHGAPDEARPEIKSAPKEETGKNDIGSKEAKKVTKSIKPDPKETENDIAKMRAKIEEMKKRAKKQNGKTKNN